MKLGLTDDFSQIICNFFLVAIMPSKVYSNAERYYGKLKPNQQQ